MRVVRVRVSAFWLDMAFRGHDYSRWETNWPADAEIINAVWEPERQLIVLNVRSSEFDEVPDGYVIPEWTPTITKHMDETAQLLDIVHRSMEESKP